MFADGLSLEFEWQQISSGLLGYLIMQADINNIDFCMFSNIPLISNTTNHFFKAYLGGYKNTNYNLYHNMFTFHSPSICLTFHFLLFSIMIGRNGSVHYI